MGQQRERKEKKRNKRIGEQEERLYGAPLKSPGAPHVITTWQRACSYDLQPGNGVGLFW